MEYTLKTDIDIKMKKSWENEYRKMIPAVLGRYGYIKLKSIRMKPSSKRGSHWWIRIESSRRLSPERLNMLQMLLLDDKSRCLINQRRIKRGVDWNVGNKLFSEVIWRKETDETLLCKKHMKSVKKSSEKYCIACKQHRIMEEGQEALLK